MSLTNGKGSFILLQAFIKHCANMKNMYSVRCVMKVPRINSLICAVHVLEGVLSDAFYGELILEDVIIILKEQLIFNIDAENLMSQQVRPKFKFLLKYRGD